MASTVKRGEFIYVCYGIDIEGTGKHILKHAMVEVAVCVMGIRADGTRVILAVFETLINVPEGRSWEQRCVDEFWMSSDKLRAKKALIDDKKGKEPEVAMKQFNEFMIDSFNKHANGDISRVRIVTDTVSYDACWINVYLAQYANANPLDMIFGQYRDLIETGSYMQGKSGITHSEEVKMIEQTNGGRFSQEKSCIEKLFITEKPTAEHNHDALSDATNIVEMFLIVMYTPISTRTEITQICYEPDQWSEAI